MVLLLSKQVVLFHHHTAIQLFNQTPILKRVRMRVSVSQKDNASLREQKTGVTSITITDR